MQLSGKEHGRERSTKSWSSAGSNENFFAKKLDGAIAKIAELEQLILWNKMTGGPLDKHKTSNICNFSELSLD